MELFLKIIDNLNIILMAVISIAFASQLIYTIFFFLPARKYKKSEIKHKIGVVICARNEESVIADTIKSLKQQSYNKELYDIYVVAHNCTDNTAQIARNNGAIVLEHNDDEPSHKKVSYALKFFFDEMLKQNKDYDFYVRFDADNLVHPEYLDKMNDAFSSGVEVARGYNNSKNLTQNVVAGVSGLWYIRDARFACQARSCFGSAQMLFGPGMMLSAKIIKEDNGWQAMGITEDAEFAMNQLFAKRKFGYVKDAICYDDQPSSVKELFKRFKRIGSGLHKLFYTHGLKSLGLFFVRWRWSYLDMFLTLFFIPIAVLCCIWFPAYYGFSFIYNLCIGNMAYINTFLITIAIALSCAFILPFILQALLVYFLDKKKINQPFKKVLPSILLFPMFTIIYAIAIFFGAFSKPKWPAIKRNQTTPLEEFEMVSLSNAKTENQNETNSSVQAEIFEDK